MSELSPETHQLLDLARGASVLTDERRSRIRAGLFTQIAAGGLAATAAGSAGMGVGKAAWLPSSLGKVVAGLALVSLTGAGVYVATRPGPSEAPTARVLAATKAVPTPAQVARPTLKAEPVEVTPSVAPDTAAKAPNAALAAPAIKSSGGPARAAANAAAVSSAPVSADSLSQETHLLRDADQALRAGNALRALTLLDEHAAQFPNGALAPERAAERMIARCQLGQVGAATASAYLSAHANSPLTARIRDACSAAR
jgi:hypothetical protein